MLQTHDRLDPQDPNDRADVAHHYAVTLKPTLADMNPAQRASAIRGYAEVTGILPEIGIKTLFALTVTGDPASRVAAVRELSELLRIDATAGDRVPPTLATYAEMVVKLADTDTIPPDEIIEQGDRLIRILSPGAKEDLPNPGLIFLAKAQNNAAAQSNEQPDIQSGTPPESRPAARTTRGLEEKSSAKQSVHSQIKFIGADTTELEIAQRSSTSIQNSNNTPEASVAGNNGLIPNLVPTNAIIDIDQMHRTFQFEPDGPGQYQEALMAPVAGSFARSAATASVARAKELFDQKILSFPEANAFQHTIWSFKVTRKFGPEIAKKFGDAHERTIVNKDGDRLKDLFNNNAGRILATDPANHNRPPEEVVLEAIRAGKLQIGPVRVPRLPAGVLQPPPRHSPL